ncbi:MAG: biotin/lipoate--protein ligase family protein [Methyloligellaceae bacterium]
MHNPDPTFPPLLKGHGVPGTESAYEVACARASAGELGAGDVIWSQHTSRVDVAIVLEPEVALEMAVQMLPLSMVAIGDCLGALTPPQVGLTFTWPGEVRVNGAFAGTMKAAAGGKRDASAVPGWMVLGLWLRLRREDSEPEPGDVPDRTWLSEEGCVELTHAEIIESYSRHFLTWINSWNEDGFKSVHASWLYRGHEKDEEVTVELGKQTLCGVVQGLDDNGNLLLRRDGGTNAALLIDYFEFPES